MAMTCWERAWSCVGKAATLGPPGEHTHPELRYLLQRHLLVPGALELLRVAGAARHAGHPGQPHATVGAQVAEADLRAVARGARVVQALEARVGVKLHLRPGACGVGGDAPIGGAWE